MTTKELTEQIVSTLLSEIPIESRNAQDLAEIEEEMSALVFGHVERYRQQMVDKACEFLAEYCGDNNISAGKVGSLLKYFQRALLIEN